MTRATTRPTARRTRALGAVAALALLAVSVAACSGSSDSSSSTSDADAMSAPAAAPAQDAPGLTDADAGAGRDGLAFSEGAGDLSLDSVTGEVSPEKPADERSLISQGNVQLRSDDVGEARFEVQKVVDRLAGEVSQEETSTDDDGEVKRSRLVLRIPSDDFGKAMTELEGAAELISSSSNVDDVTTQVIDTQVRLQVQRRSIARISLLLDRAQSIRDIVSIEGQLSRRQAVLGSLERQAAYLADQTSMATITVSLERTKPKPAVQEPEKDDKGFLAGLDAGWDAFTGVAVGLATAAGALLPFLLVLALLAIPGWPLLRRARRRTTTGTATPEAAAPTGGS